MRRILVAVVALAIAPAIGIFTSTPVTAAAGHCPISGTAHADTLNGTPGDDVICGGGGADTIHGLGGNDTIFEGPGATPWTEASARTTCRAPDKPTSFSVDQVPMSFVGARGRTS